MVDPLNHTTTIAYNALNEQTSVTNADNATTNFTYDGNGNVLTVSDGLGHVTSYSYDAMGRVLTETQPSGGGTTTYAYLCSGQPQFARNFRSAARRVATLHGPRLARAA